MNYHIFNAHKPNKRPVFLLLNLKNQVFLEVHYQLRDFQCIYTLLTVSLYTWKSILLGQEVILTEPASQPVRSKKEVFYTQNERFSKKTDQLKDHSLEH